MTYYSSSMHVLHMQAPPQGKLKVNKSSVKVYDTVISALYNIFVIIGGTDK